MSTNAEWVNKWCYIQTTEYRIPMIKNKQLLHVTNCMKTQCCNAEQQQQQQRQILRADTV